MSGLKLRCPTFPTWVEDVLDERTECKSLCTKDRGSERQDWMTPTSRRTKL